MILLFTSTLVAGDPPWGTAYVVGDIPYVIVTDREMINEMFHSSAFSQYPFGSHLESIHLDTNATKMISGLSISWESLWEPATLYPIVTSQKGYKSYFGFWPGKEIVCATLSATGEGSRVFMSIKQLYYSEGAIIVECSIPDGIDIKSIEKSSSKNAVALGYFNKKYRKNFEMHADTLAKSAQDSFVKTSTEYFNKLSVYEGQELRRSTMIPISTRDPSYKHETLYAGVFSWGEKDVTGFLVIFDGNGKLIGVEEGATSILGTIDTDRNGYSEILTFWGSGYGGGISVYTVLPASSPTKAWYEINLLHTIATVWD